MRILIAPDKFKSCLTAPQVVEHLASAIAEFDRTIEIDPCPLADGGEGTVEALDLATNGERITCRVTGPLPDMKVDATFGLISDQSGASDKRTAVVEMSAASGLYFLGVDERNPEFTTTFGTGELLLEAARHGVGRIILGIGGSATIDGGIGCCQAAGLPVILQDQGPADPHEPLVGADLPRVVLIKHGRGSPLDRIPIEVASDVTNPLYGPNGAARVFGPQKGATAAQVDQFDDWLRTLARRCDADAIANRPGAGAAGGLGFAMMAFFNANLRPGFAIVAEAVGLAERIRTADLVITGEGRLDESSLHGKVPVSVAALCRQLRVPCIAVVGGIERSIQWETTFQRVHALSDYARDTTQAIAEAPKLLKKAVIEALHERELKQRQR